MGQKTSCASLTKPIRKAVIKLYLLAYTEIQKNGKTYKVATFFDPKNTRRKVIEKFLGADYQGSVPTDKLVTPEDFADLQEVEVTTDIQGNVLTIK